MKKLFIILALTLFSCSSDETTEQVQENKCYQIISKGFDSRGDFIIINYSSFEQKRYQVGDYLEYLNQSTICEPINLTQQAL